MVNIFIYTLTNPLNNQIFYIGRAVDMKQRINVHLSDRNTFKSKKNDILKEILSAGLAPLIEEIDCIICRKSSDEAYANSVEEYWIQQFRCWGFDLANVSGVKRKYKESLKIAWERHDREFDELDRRRYSLEIQIRHLGYRKMPEQMNTPLGRKAWDFDLKKERQLITSELEAVKSKLGKKRSQYYNLSSTK